METIVTDTSVLNLHPIEYSIGMIMLLFAGCVNRQQQFVVLLNYLHYIVSIILLTSFISVRAG